MKYKLIKKCVVSVSHQVDVPYDSPCRNAHGHDWGITIQVEGNMLRPEGFLIDPDDIENVINSLNYKHLNNTMQTNPTAENVAVWVAAGVDSIIDEFWGGGHGARPFVTEVIIQEKEEQIVYTPTSKPLQG